MIAALPRSRPIRALCLYSGGLDSLLAVEQLRRHGVEVHAMAFTTPLTNFSRLRRGAAHLQIGIHRTDFSAPFIRILRAWGREGHSVPFPFGELHMAMRLLACDRFKEERFHFIATGDVLNQHETGEDDPGVLALMDSLAGLDGMVVRPLCGGRLPPSAAERKGWLSRNLLLDWSGRQRKQQRAMAGHLGWPDDLSESPRQLLLDEHFQRRLRDALAHNALDGARDLALLRIGRHFRLGEEVKLIMGRSQEENMELEGLRELGDLMLKPNARPGPTGLMPMTASDEHLAAAASLCAYYAGGAPGESVAISVRSSRSSKTLYAPACEPSLPQQARI